MKLEWIDRTFLILIATGFVWIAWTDPAFPLFLILAIVIIGGGMAS